MRINVGKIGKVMLGLANPGIGLAMVQYDQRKTQKNRRNRRIEEAYADALKRQQMSHGDIQQGHEESLTGRGLAFGGENTIGGQQRTDLKGEFALDKKELDTRKKFALEDSRYQFEGDVASDAVGAVNRAASLVGMGNAMTPIQGASLATGPTLDRAASDATWQNRPAMSPIQSAMVGVEHPSAWWGGINGLDPSGAPGSSWNRGGQVLGAGQHNDEFNVVG